MNSQTGEILCFVKSMTVVEVSEEDVNEIAYDELQRVFPRLVAELEGQGLSRESIYEPLPNPR